MNTPHDQAEIAAKVPAVTLGFWIIKVLATTLGETGGDALSMTYDFGYLASSVIFIIPLLALVAIQVGTRQFHPVIYWATIIASTTAGTTMADFATRSLGIGYPGGSLLLSGLVIGTLFSWHRACGTVNVNTVASPKTECFYWGTITFSQTLGTALGDWVADSGPGYLGGAVIFGAALAAIAVLYLRNKASPIVLFWAAFILTRPLGATIGDFLDKPLASGGLDIGRPMISLILAGIILALVLFLPQRAAQKQDTGR